MAISEMELESLRLSILRHLTDSATISRDEITTSDLGNPKVASTTTIGPVSCRVIPKWPLQERTRNDALEEVSNCDVLFTAEVDIAEGDTIVIDGQSYRVLGVLSRSPEILQRASCKRI